MMYGITLLFLITFGCTNLETSEILIRGQIVGIPSKKVYLVQANNWGYFLDSANYNGKKFSFKIPKNKLEIGEIYNFSFIDSIDNKIKTTEFVNPILSKDSIKYFIGSISDASVKIGFNTCSGII